MPASGRVDGASGLLTQKAVLDRLAGHTADAAAHLREAIQIATRIGDRLDLGYCVDEGGHLFAATRRWAEALRYGPPTLPGFGTRDSPMCCSEHAGAGNPDSRPAPRWDLLKPGQPRNAAQR